MAPASGARGTPEGERRQGRRKRRGKKVKNKIAARGAGIGKASLTKKNSPKPNGNRPRQKSKLAAAAKKLAVSQNGGENDQGPRRGGTVRQGRIAGAETAKKADDVAPQAVALEEEAEDVLPLFDDASAEPEPKTVPDRRPDPEDHHRVPSVSTVILAEVSTSLTREIGAFAKLAANSEEDQREVRLVLKRVSDVATSTFGAGAKTMLFGSRATGLSLPGGDLDIGILNLDSLDIQRAGAGFKRKDRTKASSMLKKLLNKLRKTKLVKQAQVIRARVPIIKCQMGKSNWNCDISLGVSNGDRACILIREYIKQLPDFAPLVLVVKAILMSHGLNEVFTGGLGSYSLYNMVIAHLLDHRKLAKPSKADGSLGGLLVSFLRRYGHDFDYSAQAVSITRGGFVTKRRSWVNKEKPYLIAIEDPQEEGRDIGSVSHNIRRVRQCFGWCHDVLCGGRGGGHEEEERGASAAEARDGGSGLLTLARIMHPRNALSTRPPACQPFYGGAPITGKAKKKDSSSKSKISADGKGEPQDTDLRAGMKRRRRAESDPQREAPKPKPKQQWFKKQRRAEAEDDMDEGAMRPRKKGRAGRGKTRAPARMQGKRRGGGSRSRGGWGA